MRLLLFGALLLLSGCGGWDAWIGRLPASQSPTEQPPQPTSVMGPGSVVGPGRAQSNGPIVLYYNPDNKPPDELQRLQEESMKRPETARRPQANYTASAAR